MNDHRRYGNFHPAKRSPPPVKTSIGSKSKSKSIESTSSKKLLAGYLAHEFRTNGTLLGHKFDAARAESTESVKFRPPVNGNERYEEITSLIMMKSEGGVHIPDIVNPTELARWIQM